MSSDIHGIWQSSYQYGQGMDDEPHTSEHRIKFVQDNEVWVGSSLPDGEGSELTITLRQAGREFKGE